MGYCYDSGGRLCCDVCGTSGGVRKHRCPFGYCPAVALCQKCKRAHPEYLTKDYHRKHGNCEANHLRIKRENEERQRLLDEGHFIRCSALRHNGRVKVVFTNRAGEERAYWMAPRNYRARGMGNPTTLEDYQKHGKVTRARNTHIYDAEKYAKVAG